MRVIAINNADKAISSKEPRAEIVSLLKSSRPFAGASQEDVTTLAAHVSERSYAPGETIGSDTDFETSECFFVLSGHLSVAIVDDQTGAMTVQRYSKGEEFGLASAVSGEKIDGSLVLTADGPTSVLILDVSVLDEIAKTSPEFSRGLLHYFASLASERHLKVISPEASDRQRIVGVLKGITEFIDGAWRIAKMPKHRELAQEAKVNENLVAEVIATLIANGIAERNYPGLIIKDVDELNRLAS
ncbi:MAG: hypothetical protein AAF668_02395 [Pseudomonadota bacterium]